MSTAKLSTIILVLITLVLLLDILVYGFSKTANSKTNRTSGGLLLKMTHIHDFDSPMYQHELTDEDGVERSLHISDSRMSYRANKTVHGHVSRRYKPSMWLGMNKQNFLYYVELGIGEFEDYLNPFHKVYLGFDTGSDVIWTQCEGCTQCFEHMGDNFPKSRSRTYRPDPCGQCPGPCYQDHCSYSQDYSDGTKMNGIYASETFTIGHEHVDQQFKFVCAMETTESFPGDHPGPNNVITGLLGMNKGSDSLISQLGARGQYKFSYCLRDSYSQNPMYLSIGMHVLDPAPTMPVTRILGHSDNLFVGLNGISVGRKRLKIQREAFRLRSDYSGGTVIDTGSAMTFLVSNAFDALVNEISSYIERYNGQDHIRRHTSNPNPLEFEACWEPLFNNPPVYLPTLKFHFRDSIEYMLLEGASVFIFLRSEGIPDPGLCCLAMYRADDDINLIGAYQMVDQRVIVNLQTSQFFFAQADCSNQDW